MQHQEHQDSDPKDVPPQVQLPGGVLLRAMQFKIAGYNDDHSPKLFELQPRADALDADAQDMCLLFAREEVMRREWPGGRPPQELGKYKGPKVIPGKLQLRGGVVLSALRFKIVGYDRGLPKLLELLPVGAPFNIKHQHTCVLFGREELIRNPWSHGRPTRA